MLNFFTRTDKIPTDSAKAEEERMKCAAGGKAEYLFADTAIQACSVESLTKRLKMVKRYTLEHEVKAVDASRLRHIHF